MLNCRMKRFLLFPLLAFWGWLAAQPVQSPRAQPAQPPKAQLTSRPMQWPQHKKAAIVLTYDDALLSQLDIAIPQLERAGLKATFFLTSDMDYGTLPRWREVAKKGFELGNHTLYHPCLPTEDNPVSSANYTPYQMIREIEVMNWLLFAIDGQTTRTYAYPCTDTTAGGRSYVDTLRRYKSVKYARLGGDEQTAVITDFDHLDSLRVPSLGLEEGSSADMLIRFVKTVQQRGGLGIIMFHGIGGDYITTSATVHQQLLDYLAGNKDSIWVATFQEAMDYVMQRRGSLH
jgi:peptidoglycan/xylan/chitin deacetylase (PgdA/CDA1 family)